MTIPEEKKAESPATSDALTGDERQNTPADEGAQLTLAGVVQAHGESYDGFDPAIHAVNEDGTPKRKASGAYALKRGRKAGTSAASALPPKNAAANPAVGEPGSQSEPVTINPDEAARQSANLVINASVWILGEEIGKPQDKSEAEGLKLSFKNYYEARGVPNIPPEIGLFLAIGSYIGPRMMHEKSRSKMEMIGIWFKSKFRRG